MRKARAWRGPFLCLLAWWWFLARSRFLALLGMEIKGDSKSKSKGNGKVK
jgi:hypothetical protein